MFPSILFAISLASSVLSADISNAPNLVISTQIKTLVKNLFVGTLPTEAEITDTIEKTKELLKTEPNVLHLTVQENQKMTVVGDIHGQLYDLIDIFRINGYPSEKHAYVFNGDFVDRGNFSLEVMILLMSLKCTFPHSVHLLRGNHEDKSICFSYGFFKELQGKEFSLLFEKFIALFSYLPLAAVIDEKYFVVHGGPSFTLDSGLPITVREINLIDRVKSEIEKGSRLMDLLWSDPSSKENIGKNSMRGGGCVFGPIATKAFLEANHLQVLVRSHTLAPEGYYEEHEGLCLTVFSAPNYCGYHRNKGAVLNIESGEKTVLKFEPAVHQDTEHAQSLMTVDAFLFGTN